MSQLSQGEISGVVEANRPSVRRHCWQPALDARASNASTTARVSASVVIGASGAVQSRLGRRLGEGLPRPVELHRLADQVLAVPPVLGLHARDHSVRLRRPVSTRLSTMRPCGAEAAPPGRCALRLPGQAVIDAIMAERKVRILVAKPGLDGHDRGAKVVARALRDAGFEVVYTGLHQTPEHDRLRRRAGGRRRRGPVDHVGRAQHPLPRGDRGAPQAAAPSDIVVFGGGIIPDEDIERLQAAGVKGVFTPGTTLKSIVEWVQTNVTPHS